MKLCADGSANRETGEHISNENNELVYSPFPVCNETGRPLELLYGIEEGIEALCPGYPIHVLTSNRAQLYHTHDLRSFLPSPRILYPQ